MNLRSLEEAPAAGDYLRALEREDASREFRHDTAGRLRLTPSGLLVIDGDGLELTDEALEVTVSNDNAVHRVRRPRFGLVRASAAVEAVVARARATEPRRGDTVCGGVHLTVEESGAIQVGPETFRLVCRNGAMARVCAGGRHRIRRGHGETSDRRFLGTLREFARAAWQDWEHVRRGLDGLAGHRLGREDVAHVVRGLRQAPFFISAGVARRVEAALDRAGDDLSFYDLFNAVTYVGTHDREVLPQYRHRLVLAPPSVN